MDTTTVLLADVTLVLKALLLATTKRVPASPADVALSEASVSLFSHALNATDLSEALPNDPAVHWARLLSEATAFLDQYEDAC